MAQDTRANRDVLPTVCPGDDIEGRIPALFNAVSTAMGGEPLPRPNTAPTADAGADATARTGSTVTLTGTGTDADDDLLTYSWTQTGGSPTVSLLGGGATAQTSFTAPPLPRRKTSLTLTFQLTVTDSHGAAGTDSVQVKVAKK